MSSIERNVRAIRPACKARSHAMSVESANKVRCEFARLARSKPAPHLQRYLSDMVARYPDLAVDEATSAEGKI